MHSATSYNIIDPFKVIAFNSEAFCKISDKGIVHTNQGKVQGHEEVTEPGRLRLLAVSLA